MENLHYIQIQILKELLFQPESTFSELNQTNLTNDHFTFHINQLIKLGYISKFDKRYKLTTTGKEIAGRINTQKSILIKQPKVSIGLCILNKEKDKVLLARRKREQSINKLAWFTEKVQFGESIYTTCERCLKNDTGLNGEFKYSGITHVLRSINNKLEIDAIIIYFRVINITGELITNTTDSSNEWININEIKESETLKGLTLELKNILQDQNFLLEFVYNEE